MFGLVARVLFGSRAPRRNERRYEPAKRGVSVEDVEQEALLGLWQQVRKGYSGDLGPYLMGIVRNTSVNVVRKHTTGRKNNEVSDGRERPVDREVPAGLPAPGCHDGGASAFKSLASESNTEEEAIDRVCWEQTVELAEELLDEFEYYIFMQITYHGVSRTDVGGSLEKEEVAGALGIPAKEISGQAVGQRYAKILRILQADKRFPFREIDP